MLECATVAYGLPNVYVLAFFRGKVVAREAKAVY